MTLACATLNQMAIKHSRHKLSKIIQMRHLMHTPPVLILFLAYWDHLGHLYYLTLVDA